MIARDRAGAYARGAREGAPQAQQIADRWHLLRNCSDALQNIVERQHSLVRDVGKTLMAKFSEASAPSHEQFRDSQPVRRAFRRRTGQHEERNGLFNEVVRLKSIGWSQLAIKREFGIDLKTIRKWLKKAKPGTWKRTVFTPNPADSHGDYLRRRWHEGCHNASQLYREVCERGYPGSAKTFRQWVKTRLRDGIPAPGSLTTKFGLSWRMPSSRQTVRLLTAEPGSLPVKESAFVEAIVNAPPDIAAATALARRFQCMVCDRDIKALQLWLHDATAGPMSSLAKGIRSDIDAVQAALRFPWSTGPVEARSIN